MAKFIRYALATVCFAASIGCLALWWQESRLQLQYLTKTGGVILEAECGMGELVILESSTIVYGEGLYSQYGWGLTMLSPADSLWFADEVEKQGVFGHFLDIIYFPLWYPALIFALAGVASLRFRRQFSIRSALIAVTIVSALLGMVVAL